MTLGPLWISPYNLKNTSGMTRRWAFMAYWRESLIMDFCVIWRRKGMHPDRSRLSISLSFG